jgi:hypothetical protein
VTVPAFSPLHGAALELGAVGGFEVKLIGPAPEPLGLPRGRWWWSFLAVSPLYGVIDAPTQPGSRLMLCAMLGASPGDEPPASGLMVGSLVSVLARRLSDIENSARIETQKVIEGCRMTGGK